MTLPPIAELVPADVIVVGVGVTPSVGWLEGSGIEFRDGIVCDEHLRVRLDPAGVGDQRHRHAVRRRRRRALAERAARPRDARRALDERRRAGRARRVEPARGGHRRTDPAVRAGAVLLERPVRAPHPVPRPRDAGRRGARRRRLDRGGQVPRPVRRRRPVARRPRRERPALGDADPPLLLEQMPWEEALVAAVPPS